MNRNEALALVESNVNKKRYIHTLGVVQTAIALAERFGVDVKKAELAAIFHDYAKCMPIDEMKVIIEKEEGLLPNVLAYNKELWHAVAGAILVRDKIGIDDKDIFQAILYHTTGHPNMTTLDKVIWVADYIEPNRSFPGVETARALAEKSLDDVLVFGLKNTIMFLMEKNQTIYPLTFETYNKFIKEV
ncbi:MAG: bis(5'-nucleosyl)-tetraphosphatase (symmetrical) YqeK [Bacillaceae bacterium]